MECYHDGGTFTLGTIDRGVRTICARLLVDVEFLVVGVAGERSILECHQSSWNLKILHVTEVEVRMTGAKGKSRVRLCIVPGHWNIGESCC